jgi:lipopolysaccharide transport system permease protein
MLMFPLALFASFVLAAAIGLVALPIAALYSDVSRGIQFVLRFGFFLTPVIYRLPDSGFARKLMLLNPATPVVVSGRAWLTGSNEAMPLAVGWVIAGAVVCFVAGLLFYKVTLPYLTERIAG